MKITLIKEEIKTNFRPYCISSGLVQGLLKVRLLVRCPMTSGSFASAHWSPVAEGDVRPKFPFWLVVT